MTAKIKSTPRHRGYDHPFKPKKINTRAFNQVYWPYLPVILAIGVLSSLGIRAGNFQNLVTHPTGSVLSYASSMQTQALLLDTNNQRAQASAPLLTESAQLDQAAEAKAKDMATRDYWSHDTPDGNPPWVFVTAQNYTYQKLGENLAAGFDNEQATINGWMGSPHHRENLLDTNFSQVGFGVAQNANYTAAGGGPMTIIVAFYGEPASGEPVLATVKSDNSSSNVTGAQLATARLPVVGLATDLALGAAILTLAIWAGRHARSLRKAVTTGERFAFTHPFFDVGLIIIAALCYLLTRTVGLVH